MHCAETVSKPPLLGGLGLRLSEKQIPQVIGFIRSGLKQRELLERAVVRPRQVRYQAALRPDMIISIDSKALSNFISTPARDFWPRPRTNRALIRSLHHDRAHSFTSRRSHLAGSAVELLQGFALHLQFHLGILLEDLRVSLAKHLRHPLIRNASSTQPRA